MNLNYFTTINNKMMLITMNIKIWMTLKESMIKTLIKAKIFLIKVVYNNKIRVMFIIISLYQINNRNKFIVIKII